MTDLFLQPLFTWRSAVASKNGPTAPTTRHVLLTLSLHMNEKGGSCFPSIDLLAEESALSRRAVIEHLQIAERNGWIGKRDLRKPNGQGWRRVEYFAVIPAHAEFHVQQGGAPDAPRQADAPAAPALPERGAPGAPPLAERGDPGSKRGDPNRKNVVHQGHSSTSLSTSRVKKGELASRRSPLPPGFEVSEQVLAWAKKLGFEPYLQAHLEYFRDFAVANGKLYTDWDAGFRNCIRADWGDIRKRLRIAAGKPAAETPKIERGCQHPDCENPASHRFGEQWFCEDHFHDANRAAVARKYADSPGYTRVQELAQSAVKSIR